MTLAAWPTYDSYKDSGVEWIGAIPSHWSIKRAGFLLDELNERSTNGSEPLLSLSKIHGVVRRDSMAERGGQAESLVGYRKVSKGDIVLNRMQAANGLLAVSKIVGITSPDYAIYRIKDGAQALPDIVSALLQQVEYQGEIKRRVKGVMEGFIRLYSEDLFRLPVICAPLPEQHAIAAFLDEKCAKVDEAVRIKEEQIALLRERRQILIQQAVTRGLNPAAPMKDSGIDWIGQIPAHWEVKRLKHLGNAVIGLTYDPKDLCDEDEGTLVLRSSNLKSGKFVYGDGLNAYVRMRIPEKLRIRANDILICSRNGSRDLIGKCALATHDDTGASFGAFTTVFRSEMNRYIFQILNSEIFRMLAGSFLTATINQLTTSNLNSISVPIPPPEERQALTEHLEGLNGEYDRAISFKEDQIAALKEYKTSLINAAVTGKIKVA